MTTGADPNLRGLHSDIGASAMPRLIRCPASFRLAQNMRGPRSRSSIHAATGTVAHALAEESITQGQDPASQLDQVVTVDGHEITVDEDMVRAVRVYADEITHRSQGATLARLETQVVLDPYWTVNNLTPPVSAFGTCDFWGYHAGTRHLDVLDYKNGAGVYVDVEDNPQLLYYAAGVLLELRALNLPYPLTVDLTVVQPNVPNRDPVRTYRTTALDVLIWVDDILIPTITEASQPGARISVGSHCRFCPALAACPAKARIAQDLARKDFGPTDQLPIEYTPAQLASVLNDYLLIEDHIREVRERASELLSQNPRIIPGWTLVPTRPTRSWDVDVPAIQGELISAGVSATHAALLFGPPAPRSPAQVEKLLNPAAWTIISSHVQSKSSGTKLAPDPNQNHTTTPSPQDEFA
jgi:hypothetical protein